MKFVKKIILVLFGLAFFYSLSVQFSIFDRLKVTEVK